MAGFDGGIITSDAGPCCWGRYESSDWADRTVCDVPPRSAADSAIADRNKAGFAAAKARGIKLGNAKLAVENQAAAFSAPKRSRRFCRAWRSIGAQGGGHLEWPPNCNSDRAPLVCEDRGASDRLTAFGVATAVVNGPLRFVGCDRLAGLASDGDRRSFVCSVRQVPMSLAPPLARRPRGPS
jgi:hypothetical protein